MKTRSSSYTSEMAVTFAKQMDEYIKNSTVFKETISEACNAALLEIVKPLKDEIASLRNEVDQLKLKLSELSSKANNNEQYSRRNNLRIFGIPEVVGEDCYDVVLSLCVNDLGINVSREELDRAHRVGRQKDARQGQTSPPPCAMIVKLAAHRTKMKFMKARRNLAPKKIFINEDLTKANHKLLLYVKKHVPEGVSVYSVDGTIMARSSDRVYRIHRRDDLVKFGLFVSATENADDDIVVAEDAEVAESNDS